MKKTIKRSGFTIVELVIVIAVIAVLAGVLIPTFGGIIERANYSNDNQIVANINKVLVVEDIITGREPNDVVEIQKYIKENGLSLKTKSEDNYIWYNIEKNQVFLAKLDLSGTNPALVTSEETIPVEFNSELTAPEAFIKGYLFLSEEADGDLAKCIWTLRNPESAQDLKDSLNNVKELDNGNGDKLHTHLFALMNRTAVMTEDDTFYIGEDGSAVTRIIVSSEMTTVTKNSVKDLKTRFPRVIVVDFHSGVVEMEDGAKAIISGVTDEDKMFFVYISDEIKTKYDTNPNIKYLITKDERGDEIASVKLIYIDKTGNEIGGTGTLPLTEFIKSEYKFTSNYPFQPDHKNGTTYYGFSHYSLRKDGTKDFDTDVSKEYILNEDEKLLIDSNKAFYIYAVFEEDHEDFQIGESKYSSRYMTYLLSKQDDDKYKFSSGTVITVISKPDPEKVGDLGPVLGDTSANAPSVTLTIPEGVTLLLPYKEDKTMGDGNNNISDGVSFTEMNFATGKGATQLTIASNVKLQNKGTICVDARLYYYSTPVQGFIKENECGVLEVNGTINSTGTITAYGVIRGSGNIVADSGIINEVMTIYDWYGGSNAAMAVGIKEGAGLLAGLLIDVSGKSTSPFNDWKIQNIRVPLTMKNRVTYIAKIAANIDGTPVPIDFAVLGSSDALFLMDSNAEVVRTTSNEGQNFKITINKGSVNDYPKKLELRDIVVKDTKADVDFRYVDLPLSHFDVDVAPGATLTVSNNLYKLMPESTITVLTGKNDKGERLDGVLNINTKVVICNSFDLRFDNKEQVDFQESINFTKRILCTFTPTKDASNVSNKMMHVALQPQKWGWDGRKITWVNNGNERTPLSLPIPTTQLESYSLRDSAQLIVNGTLNFDNDTDENTKAFFAGEITSNVSGATVKATAKVEGCKFNHGYGIKLGEFTVMGESVSASEWFTVSGNGLYEKTVINGADPADLAAKTYTSTYNENSKKATWN